LSVSAILNACLPGSKAWRLSKKRARCHTMESTFLYGSEVRIGCYMYMFFIDCSILLTNIYLLFY
jgi:hypothetical protein